MATVQLADIFIKKVYLDTKEKNHVENSALSRSGVIVRNPEFDRIAKSGSKLVEVPIWNDLDASGEPNYSNDDPDQKATPQKVGMTHFVARNAYLNNGWSSMDLATEIGGAVPDPMTRIKNRTSEYWMRQFQKRLIAMSKGVMAANVANNGGDMVHNIAIENGAAATADNLISRSAVVEALFTLGDAFESIASIAMHSAVYQRLVDQQQIEFIQPAGTGVSIPTYLGKAVTVDDSLPAVAGTTSGVKYTTILFGRSMFGYGEGEPPQPVELARAADAGNGSGQDILWERKTWLMHPFGHNFTSTTVTGQTPTLAQLALAANWTRTHDRKAVPLAYLVTNG